MTTTDIQGVLRAEGGHASAHFERSYEHVRLPSKSAAGYGAGWHVYLEQLAASLRGEPGHGEHWDARWAEPLPAYQAQLEA